MRRKLLQGWIHPNWLNYALLPVTFVYVCLVRLRALLYRFGVCRTRRLEAAVIVVGALAAGGSGKTPLVMALGSHLGNAGYRPGVISRGYRSKSRDFPKEVRPESSAAEVGDEALLIFEATGLPVAIGPNRYDTARVLIEKHGCNIILSDDGFQHFALHRDLDIVVMDSTTVFGNGWCLPSGPLREPRSGLGRADIVVNNGKRQSSESTGNPFDMHMEFKGARNLGSGARVPLDHFLGKQVQAVAAIGNPERFFSQLEQSGLQIVRHAFPDHHFFQASDLVFDDDHPVLMTQKDGVKCRALADADRLWAVEARAVLGAAFYERIDRFVSETL